MNTPRKKFSGLVFVACVLLFIFAFSFCNLWLVKKPLDELRNKEIPFSQFVEAVQENYTSDDLEHKNDFINISGLFARMTGRRVFNDVVLTDNGMLTAEENVKNVEEHVQQIAELSSFVKERNAQFLFVQPPVKLDKNKEMLPPGMESFQIENSDGLLAGLEEKGVNCLDLRPYLSETPEQIKEYFFDTDHHWNYTGAFIAFQHITDTILDMFPEIDTDYTDIKCWERHELEDWFLGSRGKRVGKFFAGVDDLVYYTPKFENTMSTSVPKHAALYKGDFKAANIRNDYINKMDYFKIDSYCTYVGGDYPLVQHRNYGAPVDLKVLFIKDSFSKPTQAYMSTVFQEIDALDPRHYNEQTIAEYIEYTKPDIVILMFTDGHIAKENYMAFGVEKISKDGIGQEKTILEKNEIVIEAEADNKHNCAVVSQLNYNETYILSFEDVLFTESYSDGLYVGLHNKTTNTILKRHIFDIEFGRTEKVFDWTFSTPESGTDELQLIVYSGLPGNTQGIGTVYKKINLSVLS